MIRSGERSQRDVARELGVSFATVAQIERSAIAKICAALELPCPYELHTSRSGERVWRVRRKPA